MANPAVARFSVLLSLFLASLLVNITASADSPAPAPHLSADSPSPSPPSSHVTPAPNPSPADSPQAPTPAAPPHPDSPPAPSPENSHSPSSSPSPSPSPADAADDSGVNHTGIGDVDGESSRGGMSSGKKAGIAVGVIVAVGAIALGALVYRKRRQNIERSQYGYAARRELL